MNRSIKDYNPAPCTSVPFLLDHLLNAYAVFCAAAFLLVADFFLHDIPDLLAFIF